MGRRGSSSRNRSSKLAIRLPLVLSALLLAGPMFWIAESGEAAEAATERTAVPAPADVAESLVEAEYRASRTARGLQAPNRAHGIRTCFEPTGIRVHERGGDARLHFALALRRWGRASRLESVPPGRVVAIGTGVEIRRDGLVEWYRNGPSGVEQGFTLPAPPSGIGPAAGADPDPLVLELGVEGAVAEVGDGGAALISETGRTFEYGQLLAFDAAGRSLPLWLDRSDAAGLRLTVDDRGARYPVVIDPLITALGAERVRADQPDASLGFSVAGAGDVNGDGYDDVIVGAFEWDGGEAGEGAAFLFLGGPSGIAPGTVSGADARFEGGQIGAEMGISVAGAGDVNGDGYDDVIVGARGYDAATNGGAAFLYYGSAAGILDGSPASATLTSDQSNAFFGASVAGAGDVDDDGFDDVIVGAYQYGAGQSAEGVAFVFEGGAAGVTSGDASTADARLQGDQSVALFGLSVAGAGDVNGDGYADVIVGAPLYDASPNDEGAAFIFHGSSSGIADAGAAGADTLLQSDQALANFGFSVAGAGDVDGDGYDDVLVGADEYDDGEDSEGGAFLFSGGAGGVADAAPAGAAARLTSNQEGADFGISVAGAGDVDADGYADVVVGAHLWDEGDGPAGSAFLYLGTAAGIDSGGTEGAAHQLTISQPGARFGVSVAGAGDVDADGRADVLAGASEATVEVASEGAAYLFLGLFTPALPSLAPFAAVLLCGLLLAFGAHGARSRA